MTPASAGCPLCGGVDRQVAEAWDKGYAAAVQEAARERPFTRAPGNPYRHPGDDHA